MYKKSPKGWLKHLDFIIIDYICLQLAFVFAFWIRHGIRSPYQENTYSTMAVMLTFFDLFVAFFCESYKDILKRGHFRELKATIKHVIYVTFISTFYLFILKEGDSYSRSTLVWTCFIFFGFSFFSRIAWKKYLRSKRGVKEGKRSMVLVTTAQRAEEVISNIEQFNYVGLKIAGLVLLDGNGTLKEVCGIPVVTDIDHITDFICREWVDEVFIGLPKNMELPDKLIDDCAKMGITLHLELAKVKNIKGQKQIVERIGGYAVLSTCVNYATSKQLFIKRVMDVCGAAIGCLVTGVLTLVVGPAIYIKSPGPIFFSQTRVGKNGRKFKLYKFRSMYPDAEERKAELMSRNKVKDGMMFKMEHDPRIIGGENGKGIGNFIRNTSIDEWPQFWNVLKGDMSLVGTRPPTVDEWEKYELHHRARLAIKPGITGLWQVSGRSNITDFEEVVGLDTEYIENWSFGLDIKILMKTVQVVLLGKGAA